MKKKILLSLVACFIAATSALHFNFTQNDHNMDFSLADISVMAQANPENGDTYWEMVTYSCYKHGCIQAWWRRCEPTEYFDWCDVSAQHPCNCDVWTR